MQWFAAAEERMATLASGDSLQRFEGIPVWPLVRAALAGDIAARRAALAVEEQRAGDFQQAECYERDDHQSRWANEHMSP